MCICTGMCIHMMCVKDIINTYISITVHVVYRLQITYLLGKG